MKGAKFRESTPLPTVAGGWQVILADPPWTPAFGVTCSRAVQRHYATMALADICGLDVARVAAPDSLLLLWATAPMLRQALAVLDAWCYTYRTSGVWVKPSPGTGKWLRGRHELLLLGRRGRFPAPRPGTVLESVILAPRRRHSEKPDEVYALADALAPSASRRLEMFARRRWPGWHAWGAEAPPLESVDPAAVEATP